MKLKGMANARGPLNLIPALSSLLKNGSAKTNICTDMCLKQCFWYSVTQPWSHQGTGKLEPSATQQKNSSLSIPNVWVVLLDRLLGKTMKSSGTVNWRSRVPCVAHSYCIFYTKEDGTGPPVWKAYEYDPIFPSLEKHFFLDQAMTERAIHLAKSKYSLFSFVWCMNPDKAFTNQDSWLSTIYEPNWNLLKKSWI